MRCELGLPQPPMDFPSAEVDCKMKCMQIAAAHDPVFSPLVGFLTPDVAKRIVDFRIDEATQKRLDEWADSASEGRLSAEDQSEYEILIDKLDMLATLKSLARQALQNQP